MYIFVLLLLFWFHHFCLIQVDWLFANHKKSNWWILIIWFLYLIFIRAINAHHHKWIQLMNIYHLIFFPFDLNISIWIINRLIIDSWIWNLDSKLDSKKPLSLWVLWSNFSFFFVKKGIDSVQSIVFQNFSFELVLIDKRSGQKIYQSDDLIRSKTKFWPINILKDFWIRTIEKVLYKKQIYSVFVWWFIDSIVFIKHTLVFLN